LCVNDEVLGERKSSNRVGLAANDNLSRSFHKNVGLQSLGITITFSGSEYKASDALE